MQYDEPRLQQRIYVPLDSIGRGPILLVPEGAVEMSNILHNPGATGIVVLEYTLSSHTALYSDPDSASIIWVPWTAGDVGPGETMLESEEYPISAVRAYVSTAEAGAKAIWEFLADKSGLQKIKLL